MKVNTLQFRPAGYAYLIKKFNISAIPHWHISSVATTGSYHSKVQSESFEEIYPSRYWPGDKVGPQLEFALKYDGINLAILKQIFETAPQAEIIDYIKSKPTGKYARRIWFFYEFLTASTLPIKDAGSGNYVPALEPDKYYTIIQGDRSQRHRIVNNLLGPSNFCPLVRKTSKLKKMELIDLHQRCKDIVSSYPVQLLRRALDYLYTKETKSSFEIEQAKPNPSRIERFIFLLSQAEQQDFCSKELLLDLQNQIVDPRFKDSDYRNSQNYVGQAVSYEKEIIHYVCPRPEDLPDLMHGLLTAHNRMTKQQVQPLIHAAVIAYGFVFMHPFEDGNGRIHRFLIHNILSMQGMLPEGIIFPVSATMLKNMSDYDRSLENFSRPLLQLIDYTLDEYGQMLVTNQTSCWYQYMDMTFQAEALYTFIEKTIKEELVSELDFLISFDKSKKAIQEIIDMPDRLIDLFIRFCRQNSGKISNRKRKSHFDFLTDEEVNDMEIAIQKAQKKWVAYV